MQKDFRQRWNIIELSLSVFTLVILFIFTDGIFVYAPYAGFQYDPTNGKILSVYIKDEHPPTLQAGDTLVLIGNIPWTQFDRDNRVSFFTGAKSGDIVEIVVRRDNQQLTIPWKFPGFTRQEFNSFIRTPILKFMTDHGLIFQLEQPGMDPVLHFESLVLNFEEEVVLAKQIAVGGRRFPRGAILTLHQPFCDFALQAAGEPDQSTRMFRQKLLADPWLVIETMQ